MNNTRLFLDLKATPIIHVQDGNGKTMIFIEFN